MATPGSDRRSKVKKFFKIVYLVVELLQSVFRRTIAFKAVANLQKCGIKEIVMGSL